MHAAFNLFKSSGCAYIRDGLTWWLLIVPRALSAMGVLRSAVWMRFRHIARSSVQSSLFANRAFSSCDIRHTKAIPAFHETSTPALNQLLRITRERIFLPDHLPYDQRKLLSKPRYHDTIAKESLAVELGSERFRLQPLTPWTDVPNQWASVLEALRLMHKDTKSWLNFLPLMVGMHQSGRRWKTQQMCKIIEIVGQQGQLWIVVEAARRAEDIGLSLQELPVVRELMWACRMHAVRNNWTQEAVATALKSAIQLGELLDQNLSHLPSVDPRTQPDIVSVVVELAGARAVLHHQSRDTDGLLRTLTKRLTANLHHYEGKDLDQQKLSLKELDSELLRAIPLRNSLLLADEVLGSDMPNSRVAQQLRARLDELLSDVRVKMHRGPKSLRSSSRRTPSWICDSQRFTRRKRGSS